MPINSFLYAKPAIDVCVETILEFRTSSEALMGCQLHRTATERHETEVSYKGHYTHRNAVHCLHFLGIPLC